MANPVTDALDDWQNDADAGDTNQPIDGTAMGTGQPGDLDGEFRRVKSELRSESIIKSWERWLGLKNIAAAANIAFTYSSSTVFTVNDNFTGASRLVAVLGRRVRALLSGSTVYGTITAASFSSPTTTITVAWDSGGLDATLLEVQFGPEGRAVGMIQNVRVSPTAPTVGQIWRHDGTQMVPVQEVGVFPLTNRTGGAVAVGDIVTLSTANDNSVVLADTASSKKQLLVALDAAANLATARFVSFGIYPINVTGAVTAGRYLVKSATTLVAADSALAQGDTVGLPQGAFAIALTAAAGPGAGAVYALLLGATHSNQYGATPVTQAFGDAAAEGTSEAAARGDHKHGMPNAARLYDRPATQLLSIANNNTKQTLYSFSIGANDLGTTKAVRTRIFGDYFNNSGGARIFTLEIAIGATVMFADVTAALSVSAQRRAFVLDFIIGNQNSASVQVMGGTLKISLSTVPTTGNGNLGGQDTISASFGGAATEDTAGGAKTVTVSITHSASSASLDIRRQSAITELI